MTEPEIMKALEKALTMSDEPIGECFYCGLTTKIVKEVQDLIKRKNAEAEAMKSHIRLLESENERLKKIINTSAIILPARKCGKTFLIKTTIEKITESARTAARSEAIKLFAGRLKARRRKMLSSDWLGEFWDYAVLVEDIDQIAKEMGVEL